MENCDVNDDRHYKNPYKDYIPEESDTFFDSIRDIVKQTTANLIVNLESTEKNWGHSHDISIYNGTTGIAYAFYHYGVVSKNITFINKAQRIIDKCEKDSKSKREISFMTGTAGLMALEIVLNTRKFEFGTHKMNEKKATEASSKLKSFSKYVLDETSGIPDELLYGRVGYLYALLFVNAHSPIHTIDEDIIEKVVNCVINSGKNYSHSHKSQTPLMYAWHNKEYLGGAHGIAGILYLLLQARKYLTAQVLKNYIEPTLQYLIDSRYNFKNFPSSVGSKTDKLVHWCHGAPSMTMLFLLAYEVFGKEQYLQTALECGEVVWMRGLLKKGYSICHGVSGNAYTFLYLFQQTNDKKFLYRALKFGEWIIKEEHFSENREPDHPFSLFEGKAGHLYFLTDLLQPMNAKFPGYTV